MIQTMVMAAVMAMGAAADRVPNPEILRWQMEAQERERAMARRIDWQMERGKGPSFARIDRLKPVPPRRVK